MHHLHLNFSYCYTKARAIESQCYVLAAAQVGKHNEKRQSYGHSVGEQAFDISVIMLVVERGIDMTQTHR